MGLDRGNQQSKRFGYPTQRLGPTVWANPKQSLKLQSLRSELNLTIPYRLLVTSVATRIRVVLKGS
jgi:hypothetical protein